MKVIIDDLNYRSEPSMKGKVNGQTGRGTFTIMEVQNGGWGRLKSGAGWIWLSNPTYCTVGKTVKNTEDTQVFQSHMVSTHMPSPRTLKSYSSPTPSTESLSQ